MAFLVGGANSAADTGYDIDNSLRFNDDDSACLSWTPASAGNQKTFTFSGWVKRSNVVDSGVFGVGTSGSSYWNLRFQPDYISVVEESASLKIELRTNALYRDSSAWYHIVLAIDTTQGTDTNRAKLYVNGEQVTSFSTEVYPDQDEDLLVNSTTPHYLGRFGQSASGYLDGYLAEVHFIDGTQYAASDFGETDSDSGIWKPIDVSGLTFGTNGFYLSFAGSGVMSATGGDSTDTDGDYKAASFISDGTFTPSDTGYVEYLVIGGGGGGGSSGNGTSAGGGAGGYRTGYLAVTGLTEYSITVGDGGGAGASGDDSIFSTITSNGGGGGGSRSNTEGSRLGKTGGSAGGSAISDGAPLGVTPLVAGNEGGFTPVEGYSGGASADFQGGTNATAALGAGGGGGANASGSAGSGQSGGAGGAGRASSITGSSVTRAGGGGGAAGQNGTLGSGGSGGGGNGGKEATDAVAGTANTGSGGGGCPRTNSSGFGAGGSGIVIIRYKFQ